MDLSNPCRILSGACNYYPQLSDEEIRFRGVQYLAEGHMASKDLKPGSLPRPLAIHSHPLFHACVSEADSLFPIWEPGLCWNAFPQFLALADSTYPLKYCPDFTPDRTCFSKQGGRLPSLLFALLLVAPNSGLEALLKQGPCLMLWYPQPSAQYLYVEGPSFMFVEVSNWPHSFIHKETNAWSGETCLHHKASKKRAKARLQDSWSPALPSRNLLSMHEHLKEPSCILNLS